MLHFSKWWKIRPLSLYFIFQAILLKIFYTYVDLMFYLIPPIFNSILDIHINIDYWCIHLMYIMTVIVLFLEYASFHLSSVCASLVVREHSAYIILYLSLSRTLLRKNCFNVCLGYSSACFNWPNFFVKLNYSMASDLVLYFIIFNTHPYIILFFIIYNLFFL